MAGDSPAVIIFDELGNPIGVSYDGYQYRLLTDSRLTDGYSIVGVTNIAPGVNALKVDVVKTVSGGGVGVGGTSSSFVGPFPDAGTAAGYFDGYYMQSAKVFDLDTSGGNEFVIGTNLRTFANGGSVEVGTSTNPLHAMASLGSINPSPSIGNSTAIPLLGDAIFHGVSEDVSEFVSIDVTVLSDKDSATNGLVFEWSQDNILFSYSELFTISANVGQFFSLSPRAKYFRTTYTNGSVAQTSFNMSAVYYPITRSTFVHNLDVDVSNQNAAEIIRSVIAAKSLVSGNYTNLVSDGYGALYVKDLNADGYLQSILNNQMNGTQHTIVDGYIQTNPVVSIKPSSISSTSTITSSNSNVLLLSVNQFRIGATIFNDSMSSLYVKLGMVASLSDYTVKMISDSYYEVPYNYLGEIDGIWSSVDGYARVTELT